MKPKPKICIFPLRATCRRLRNLRRRHVSSDGEPSPAAFHGKPSHQLASVKVSSTKSRLPRADPISFGQRSSPSAAQHGKTRPRVVSRRSTTPLARQPWPHAPDACRSGLPLASQPSFQCRFSHFLHTILALWSSIFHYK